MAKLIIELEDTPYGVTVTAKGDPLPPDKKNWTEAHRLLDAIRQAIDKGCGHMGDRPQQKH